jgi:SAM-dependent methyltransferase
VGESPLGDGTARQYNKWPYPQPAEDLEAYAKTGRDTCDPAMCHRLFWPDREYPEGLEILVAGCGANQAADIAFHNPRAKVFGIDVSAASLAHEEYLKTKHNLTNLDVRRLPIENVAELGREFDLVICTGVLHHMADPLAGIRALATRLRRDAVLAGYLYGKYGRFGLEMMQSLFLGELGLTQDEPSLALVKETLPLLLPHHPVQVILPRLQDKHFDAGLVDEFLNARERTYTVGETLDYVAAGGLVFQSWVENSHYYPEAYLQPTTSLYKAITAQPEAKQWAATDLLACNSGHFFVACRHDRPTEQYKIDFNGPDVVSYIPVRRPGVRVLQAEPATGKPARLERDGMEVPVSDVQGLLLACVDGNRSIGQILQDVQPSLRVDRTALERFGREYFRSLWRLGLMFVKLARR